MNVHAQFPPSYHPAPPPPDTVDARSIFRFFLRRGWTIIAVALAVTAATFLLQMIQPRQFAATAQIMVDPGQQQAAINGAAPPPGSVDSGLIDSQIQLLIATPTLERIVEALKLDADPYWIAEARRLGLRETWASLFGAKPAAPDAAQLRMAVVHRLQEAIDVRRVGSTYVLALKVTTKSAYQSARVANTWVNAYLDTQMEARLAATHRTNDWLSSRLSTLKDDIKTKEDAVESYRRANGLLTTEGVSLTEQQLRDLQGSMITARADLAEKKARYDQLQSLVYDGRSIESSASVLNSDTIQNLRAQQAEVMRREAEMQTKYGPKHPELIKASSERLRLEDQISLEVSRIRENARNELEVAQARLGSLLGNLGSMQGRLMSDNSSAVKLRELERDAAATRTVYEAFLGRFRESSETQSFQIADARLVSGASTPTRPESPRVSIALMLSLVVGSLAGMLAGMTREMLDNTIDDAESVPRLTGRSLLASVPRAGWKDYRRLPRAERNPVDLTVSRPMSAFAESLRALRASLLYSSAEPGRIKVVAMASPLPGEGKSTLALCLARVTALSGERVLLIDCDLRRHTIGDRFSVLDADGLAQVQAGEADWRDVIVRDEATGCDVIGAGRSNETPLAERVSALRAMIAQARETYDLIVLDCPPVLVLAESRAICREADGVVMIANWGRTLARMVRASIERVEGAGGEVVGVALNFATPGRMEYGELAAYGRAYNKYYHV